jgi:hypothetical protein
VLKNRIVDARSTGLGLIAFLAIACSSSPDDGPHDTGLSVHELRSNIDLYYLGSGSFLQSCAGSTLGCGLAISSVPDSYPYFSGPAWLGVGCDQWVTFRRGGRCVEAQRLESSDFEAVPAGQIVGKFNTVRKGSASWSRNHDSFLTFNTLAYWIDPTRDNLHVKKGLDDLAHYRFRVVRETTGKRRTLLYLEEFRSAQPSVIMNTFVLEKCGSGNEYCGFNPEKLE